MIGLILLINMWRTTPVIENKLLTEIAQERAEDLCKTNSFSHQKWMVSEKNRVFKNRGENLAKGYTSAKAVHNAFLNSPTHKHVIQNEVYKYVGIGHACDIVVEEFAGELSTEKL